MSGGAWEDCFTPAQLGQAHSLIGQLVGRHITVTASSGASRRGRPGLRRALGARPEKGRPVPRLGPPRARSRWDQAGPSPKSGSYITETAWDGPNYGSNGGFSGFFARPSYQDGVAAIGAHRGVPDVAADASMSSGLGLIFALASGPMAAAAGTRARAPFRAGLVALADQFAGRDLGTVNPAIYDIAHSAGYHAAYQTS